MPSFRLLTCLAELSKIRQRLLCGCLRHSKVGANNHLAGLRCTSMIQPGEGWTGETRDRSSTHSDAAGEMDEINSTLFIWVIWCLTMTWRILNFSPLSGIVWDNCCSQCLYPQWLCGCLHSHHYRQPNWKMLLWVLDFSCPFYIVKHMHYFAVRFMQRTIFLKKRTRYVLEKDLEAGVGKYVNWRTKWTVEIRQSSVRHKYIATPNEQ